MVAKVVLFLLFVCYCASCCECKYLNKKIMYIKCLGVGSEEGAS